MMLALAQLISFISNPVFLTIPLPFFLVYNETSDAYLALKWMIFSMFFIVLVGFFVMYEVRRRVFTDLDVSKREQRPLLFVFMIFVAFLYLLSLFLLHGPTILYVAVCGIIGSIIILALINERIKASIHVATISAFFCVLAILYGGANLLWLLCIPVVVWSRVRTNRHSLQEALVGCVMGIMLTLGVYIFVKSVQLFVL